MSAMLADLNASEIIRGLNCTIVLALEGLVGLGAILLGVTWENFRPRTQQLLVGLGGLLIIHAMLARLL